MWRGNETEQGEERKGSEGEREATNHLFSPCAEAHEDYYAAHSRCDLIAFPWRAVPCSALNPSVALREYGRGPVFLISYIGEERKDYRTFVPSVHAEKKFVNLFTDLR